MTSNELTTPSVNVSTGLDWERLASCLVEVDWSPFKGVQPSVLLLHAHLDNIENVVSGVAAALHHELDGNHGYRLFVCVQHRDQLRGLFLPPHIGCEVVLEGWIHIIVCSSSKDY